MIRTCREPTATRNRSETATTSLPITRRPSPHTSINAGQDRRGAANLCRHPDAQSVADRRLASSRPRSRAPGRRQRGRPAQPDLMQVAVDGACRPGHRAARCADQEAQRATDPPPRLDQPYPETVQAPAEPPGVQPCRPGDRNRRQNAGTTRPDEAPPGLRQARPGATERSAKPMLHGRRLICRHQPPSAQRRESTPSASPRTPIVATARPRRG